MVTPLLSGRTWATMPHGEPIQDPHRSELRRLRDAGDHSYTVLFKRPADNAPAGELYSIGMDRVAYSLGAVLELPVAPVFLESFEGNEGAMLETITNEVSWYRFEKASPKLKNEGLVNSEDIPRCVAFDIWMANTDRRKRNLLLQPVPAATPHDEARKWKLWLIDHGACALWPPGKFGLEKDAPAADVDLERFLPEVETIIANEMPDAYRNALYAEPEDRNAALTAVLAISDDQIVGAVNEIPHSYFSERERELTIRFLRDRRNQIAGLCA